MSFSQRLQEIRDGFARPFWVANISELFERLSYYAAFASLARYLHEALNFPTERAADLAGREREDHEGRERPMEDARGQVPRLAACDRCGIHPLRLVR